jgi:chaperonin GroEL
VQHITLAEFPVNTSRPIMLFVTMRAHAIGFKHLCCALVTAHEDEALQVCENDEQRMGADIVKKALPYPLKLIAFNAGVNGSVVMDKILASDDSKFGYNAATDKYEDLMAGGILDPTKVIRCCLENSNSVARTFLMADVVVTQIPEEEGSGAGVDGGAMGMGGY